MSSACPLPPPSCVESVPSPPSPSCYFGFRASSRFGYSFRMQLTASAVRDAWRGAAATEFVSRAMSEIGKKYSSVID